jgi:glycosyltransferase involved in cell wall biosynthesis
MHPGRRLLYLAHYFPPASAIGAVRAWSTAKYLARLGWKVTVVTPAADVWRRTEDAAEAEERMRREGVRAIRTPQWLRSLSPAYYKCHNAGLGRWIGGACRRAAGLVGVEPEGGWAGPLRHVLKSLDAEFDVILATGSPYCSFSAARAFSAKLNSPFVLDYRDPWTEGNPHLDRAFPSRVRRLEAQLSQKASAVTIVSPSWGRIVGDRFGIREKIHLITNGFDSEELAQIQPDSFDHFAIIYAGMFYPPKRVLTPILDALRTAAPELDSMRRAWRFHYFGSDTAHVVEETRRCGLEAHLVLHGAVPRHKVLAALKGADLALVVTSVTEDSTLAEQGLVTGKIFEALGLGTRVLLVAPEGSDAEGILKAAGAGAAFRGRQVSEMARFFIEHGKESPGRLCPPAWLDWKHLAGRLQEVLDGACLMHGQPRAL